MNAKWEHGYRCHGLWRDDGNRLGGVGIGPPHLWDGVYRWWVDGSKITGEASTLRAAKMAVENAIAEILK